MPTFIFLRSLVRVWLTWLAVLSPAASFGSSSLSGTVRHADKLYVDLPFHGAYFTGNRHEISPDANGHFHLDYSLDRPGFVYIYASPYEPKITLYASPDASDSVTFDAKDVAGTVQFFGATARQHQFIQQFFRETELIGYGSTPTEKRFMQDTVPERIYANVLKQRDQELQLLDKYVNQYQPSAPFAAAMEHDIRYYHVAILNSIALNRCIKHQRGKVILNDEWKAFRRKAIELEKPSTDAALVTRWYDEFVNYSYPLYYLNLIANFGNLPAYALADEAAQMQRYFDNRTYQHAFATFVRRQVEKNYARELMSLCDEFIRQYPGSVYRNFVVRQADTLQSYFQAQAQPYAAGTHFITDSVTSFAGLVEPYRGKVVFVDMWATWCGPCKTEFTYSDALKKRFASQNVVFLYLSIDDPERDAKWKEMVKYYRLTGENIRANALLNADLRARFGTETGSIAIPRYVIVDRNGNVTVANAYKPSKGEKLYRQIAALLKAN